MSIPAIESVLDKMQIQTLQASNIAKPQPVQAGFATQLVQAVGKINETRMNATNKVQAFTLVPLSNDKVLHLHRHNFLISSHELITHLYAHFKSNC